MAASASVNPVFKCFVLNLLFSLIDFFFKKSSLEFILILPIFHVLIFWHQGM